MGKITVKHYLNTNLKPYVVRGENYYSMYIMVIVNRKSTKVKSISFEELYTEKDFEEIQNEDNSLLNDEAKVIESICSLIVDVFGDFDAGVFSSYYILMNDLFVDDVEFETMDSDFSFYAGKDNPLGLNLQDYIFGDFSLSINRTHGMSLFTWFSTSGQKELLKYLKRQKIKYNSNELICMLNKSAFLGSMKAFSSKLDESKKGRELYNKYAETIDNDCWIYYDTLRNKLGK